MNHAPDDAMNPILVVDDEPQIRHLLANILEDCGYPCVLAEDVASARKILREMPVDLVLTDQEMPGESGIDLIRHIKKEHPRTGVVMVTIIDNIEQAREVLALGVYGYITKPFTRNQVLIAVENALRRRQAELQAIYHSILLEQEVAQRTETLNEQLHFLQTLLDAIPVPISYKDANGVFQGVNRSYEEVIGLPRHAIVGKTAADIHVSRLAKTVLEKDGQLLRTGVVQRYETTMTYPDGTPWVSITHKAAFTNSAGQIAGLVGVRLDITELKAIEQSLRLSEEKLRSVMNNLRIGVIMINTGMELIQINRQMRRWFPDIDGKSALWFHQQVVGKPRPAGKDLSGEEFLDFGQARESTVTLATAEGERIFKVFFSPIDDDRALGKAVIGLFEDVTDALAAERELRQAQKLEAIGQLSAGIAHEINTPIQYVGDNVRFLGDAFRDLTLVHEKSELLLHAVQQDEPAAGLARELATAREEADVDFLLKEIPTTIAQTLEGVDRVATIVRAMKEFSHPGSEEKTHVDVNRALESTITVSRNEWKYVAEVETRLATDLPLLLCLPGELNQVFLNIIVNAAHAIGDFTGNGKLGKGVIMVSTRTNEDWMEIRIADTGGGIPEAVQDRIFDPFFTTKKVGKGTGQGLAIARSVVVDKHQGMLRFETEAGKGTTFIIQLPLH